MSPGLTDWEAEPLLARSARLLGNPPDDGDESMFQAGMDVVYLVYGLSFLAMGMAIFIRYEHESQLKLAHILWLLGAFGLVHGIREWLDLWRVVRGDGPVLAMVRPILLLVSFIPLFEFGRRLMREALAPAPGRLLGGWIYLPLLGGIAAGTAFADQPLVAMDIWARYLLGVTGSFLTAAGFWLYCGQYLRPVLTGPNVGRVQTVATASSLVFVAYGVFGGLVVPAAPWFPAALINQDRFLALFGIPIQLCRAATAVIMAVAVGSLLKVFHLEAGQRLREALVTTEQTLSSLRRLTRQNKLILDSTSEGILGLDLDGNTVFVNTAAERLLGFERDDLIGRSTHIATHHTTAAGEPYPQDMCPVWRSMREQRTFRVSDDLFWRKDGSSFAVEYEASPLFDEGQVVGVVVVFQDITERKRGEDRIRESEERFRTLVEGTTDWVWETDDLHRFRWFSDSFESVIGVRPAALIGKRRWDAASENHQIDPALWQDHIADLHAHRPFRDFRYWIARLHDGSARWISISGSPRFDNDGRFLGYRGSGSDITADAETSLRLKMLSTVVEQSPISVVITAPDSTIQYVNNDTVRLTGYSCEELVGSSIWTYQSGDTPAVIIGEMRQVIEAGGSWCAELESRRKTGETFWERVTVSPVLDDADQIIHHLWIREDISFRKDAAARIAEANRRLAEQAVQLQRSNAELEQFAYVASHDLRQPLRMISSYLSLIDRSLRPTGDDSLRKYMDFALGGARRLDRLILDLLEYSRIGRQQRPFEAVALDSVVGDAVLDLKVAIQDAEATVSVADGLPTVMGDATELTRLFQNLIGNAVKYRASDRKPLVSIGWREDGDEVMLWVADNGIGIPADQRDRAFAVFQRLVAKDQYEGTGIGLAVCKKIAEHNNGRIWIDDNEGQGTIFYVAFPKLRSSVKEDIAMEAAL